MGLGTSDGSSHGADEHAALRVTQRYRDEHARFYFQEEVDLILISHRVIRRCPLAVHQLAAVQEDALAVRCGAAACPFIPCVGPSLGSLIVRVYDLDRHLILSKGIKGVIFSLRFFFKRKSHMST